MFRLRPARCTDLDDLLDLARFLDSPNLPVDADFLRARLARSEASFAAPGPASAEREYQFALEDEQGRMVGTSAIISKHGTPDMPHVYLQVGHEVRESPSAGIRAEHLTFRLGTCEDGPTELGSLVLHPDARGRRGRPGKLLSWGRFAYIARHRGAFEERILAEMRASLDPEGRNAFWEAFGRNFTGMTYEEADRLSATEKQFILDLFPRTLFYATLLEDDVAEQLGMVHEETLPAVRLLEQAGFKWIGEIDPFDAGPFYGAATRDVLPVRDTRAGVVALLEEPASGAPPCVASAEGEGRGYRAVATRALPPAREGGAIGLAKEAADALDLEEGDAVALTPLPESRRGRTHRKGTSRG